VLLYFQLLFNSLLRLAINTILNGDENNFVTLIGVVNSSWVGMSRGTTLRSFLNPLGDSSNAKVMLGNVMVSRQS
jgi:hypothetical protein